MFFASSVDCINNINEIDTIVKKMSERYYMNTEITESAMFDEFLINVYQELDVEISKAEILQVFRINTQI